MHSGVRYYLLGRQIIRQVLSIHLLGDLAFRARRILQLKQVGTSRLGEKKVHFLFRFPFLHIVKQEKNLTL